MREVNFISKIIFFTKKMTNFTLYILFQHETA
jgi:hypothetical protein